MSRFEEVSIKGTVDSSNSSSTPLAGSGVFTGTSTDILGTGIVFVNVYADVASATDGLSIQQSSDGTNWDHADDYTITAGATKNFSINPHSQYMRIVYTNGASAQGAFRLQTILKGGSAKESSHRIKDAIIGDDDCELVKAAITGEDDLGTWHNVGTTEDGYLSISDNSSGLSIAEGNVTGKTFIHKFGEAPDFDSGDGEVTIWDGADDGTTWENMVYDYSTTADIDSISSSNSGDTSLTIEVRGLDSNYDVVTQTATLDAADAQTRVALTTSLIRVFRLKNTSSTDLAGTVTVYPNTGLTNGVPTDTSKIRAIIRNGENQTLMAIYTIPNGKTGYLRDWYSSSAGANKTSNYKIKLKARPFGQVFQTKHVSALNETGSSQIQHKYVEPEIFDAKTDLELTVQTTDSPITAANISGGFDIVLVDD